MAAAEEQEERVVAFLGGARQRFVVRRLLPPGPRDLAAPRVDEPPGRDRRQPSVRIVRRIVWPDPQRLDQRLLQRILGGVEILAPPDQPGEHARDEGAQGTLVQPLTIGHARPAVTT